jgi:hypothetical protein
MSDHTHTSDVTTSPADDLLAHACRWFALFSGLALCVWSMLDSVG